ncbi:MAG: DUF4412 domain-containing protein [Bacteroidia bacterium]|nr:DUF4412 domain-containing protein [Bacteroidia bacterium]
MKNAALSLMVLIFCGFSVELFAGNFYAEYKISGIGDKVYLSKLYAKNGDMRSEMTMDMGGKEMTTVTLKLKSNPDVAIVYNSESKTYNEVKGDTTGSKASDMTVKVIGNEKIGSYNCKHIRMTSEGKSWDMWVTKDLPAFNFPLEKNDEVTNKKIMELLKKNDAEGMPVKLSFGSPGMVMELVKYEAKEVDDALFKIPPGYTKSTVSYDAEKMKNMTDEERREMIMKMMEENMPKK